jgi:hypothetical protein
MGKDNTSKILNSIKEYGKISKERANKKSDRILERIKKTLETIKMIITNRNTNN